MLSHAEISDRLEIQQLTVDYSTAIDTRRFDDLDAVFTPDAYIDYTALGGIEGRYPEVKAWLAEVLPNFPMYAHMLGNFSVRIDGDTASSRTICFNPMVLPAATKEDQEGDVLRALVRRRVPPYRRRLADDPPGRDEVLSENPVAARAGEFPTSGLVLAQWAAVCRATHRLPRCSFGGHTREAKPDSGIPPESLNCSVTPVGEVA